MLSNSFLAEFKCVGRPKRPSCPLLIRSANILAYGRVDITTLRLRRENLALQRGCMASGGGGLL